VVHRFTLTTPLYYVNDKPHIGSVYTTLAADAMARWRRLQGDRVCLITGCDEHGLKIQRSAAAAGVPTRDYVDRMAGHFAALWQRMGISHNRFVRTSAPRHQGLVHEFYERVRSNGHIRMGRQQGWYCVACEEFKDVDNEDGGTPRCAIHDRPLEWRDEENLFFCLSHFQEPIAQLVERESFIGPPSRRREVQRFVEAGLRDFSISRVDLPWGIPVPHQPGHTFYVWFDALLGYITALGDPDGPQDLTTALASGWPAQLHLIGKDILRFHAVYWPAMLLAADLPLPERVFGHGFLTREGRKMGKTLGNTLDPEALFAKVGVEPVRWYLLRDIQFGEDGDIQQKRFLDLVNNDLANTIGNLVNRTVSMSRRWFGDCVPPEGEQEDASPHPLAPVATAATARVGRCFARQDLQGAAMATLSLAEAVNGHLSEQAPWSAIKDASRRDGVAAVLYGVLEATRLVGLCLQPLVPELSNRLLIQLGCEPLDSRHGLPPGAWERLVRWGGLPHGQPLPEASPLMARLELDGDL